MSSAAIARRGARARPAVRPPRRRRRAARPKWLGDDLPLPLPVKTPQDIGVQVGRRAPVPDLQPDGGRQARLPARRLRDRRRQVGDAAAHAGPRSRRSRRRSRRSWMMRAPRPRQAGGAHAEPPRRAARRPSRPPSRRRRAAERARPRRPRRAHPARTVTVSGTVSGGGADRPGRRGHLAASALDGPTPHASPRAATRSSPSATRPSCRTCWRSRSARRSSSATTTASITTYFPSRSPTSSTPASAPPARRTRGPSTSPGVGRDPVQHPLDDERLRARRRLAALRQGAGLGRVQHPWRAARALRARPPGTRPPRPSPASRSPSAPEGARDLAVTVGGDKRPSPFVPDKYGHKRQPQLGY